MSPERVACSRGRSATNPTHTPPTQSPANQQRPATNDGGRGDERGRIAAGREAQARPVISTSNQLRLNFSSPRPAAASATSPLSRNRTQSAASSAAASPITSTHTISASIHSPSRLRSSSPALSISSVVKEPWSAYSRAYAAPLYHHRRVPSRLEEEQRPTDGSLQSRLSDGDFEEDGRIGGLEAGQNRGISIKMPLGIWDTKDGFAPGTVTVMRDESSNSVTATATAVQGSLSPQYNVDPKLKYDYSGKRPILLVPQPTDDPNDPLNWPRWRRDSILVVLSFMSVIASTLSPLLAANTWLLFVDFDFDYTLNQMALLTGYHLLAVGLAGFLFVATARVWGKRHLYLLGTLLIIASSAWGGATGLNYRSLLGARIVQGIGLAPFEALVNASVGDLFFVHERGSRMALSNMALFGGAFFTPIIVGKMTDTIGWQWSFYLIAIFAGVMFPFIFFFVPETTYPRPEGTITDADSFGNPYVAQAGATAPTGGSFSGPLAGATSDPVQKEYESDERKATDSTADEAVTDRLHPARISYWKSLSPFSGRKSNENIFKLILRPIPLFLQPAILWACLIQGTLIGWTVLMGVVLAAIFISPPLLFSEVETGYMYTGPFIGALVGFALSGLLADWSVKLLIRANKGVYEPEFRIPLVILQLLLGCAGLYGFGWTSSQVRYGGPNSWFWPDFCFALEVAGMVVGAVASALYIVDAHREISVEAFTCLLIFKNIFSFSLTYQAFEWLQGSIWRVFLAIGSVQAGVCALSIPMWKRNRALFAKYNILKLLGLW